MLFFHFHFHFHWIRFRSKYIKNWLKKKITSTWKSNTIYKIKKKKEKIKLTKEMYNILEFRKRKSRCMQSLLKYMVKLWFSGFLKQKKKKIVDASVSAFACISLQFSSSSSSSLLLFLFGHSINSSVTWMPTHTQANRKIFCWIQEITFIQYSHTDADLYRCLFSNYMLSQIFMHLPFKNDKNEKYFCIIFFYKFQWNIIDFINFIKCIDLRLWMSITFYWNNQPMLYN